MERAVQESERKVDKLRRQSESMKQIYDDGLIKKNDQGLYQLVNDQEEAQKLHELRSKPKKRENIDPINYEDVDEDLDLEEDIE